MFRLALVSLTATSVSGCKSSDPDAGRVALPDAPENFGKEVDLPNPVLAKHLREFGMEAYAAALLANSRLRNDRLFWKKVREEYARKHNAR